MANLKEARTAFGTFLVAFSAMGGFIAGHFAFGDNSALWAFFIAATITAVISLMAGLIEVFSD